MNQLATIPKQPVPTGQLVTSSKCQIAITSVTELVQGANEIGQMLFNAKRFGFNTIEDAKSHALICIMTGQDPMGVLAETDSWQFIQGQRQMKYRAMANRFLRLGGKIKPKSRTPELVAAELSRDGIKVNVDFSWAECQKEDYVWNKDAKIGKVKKFLDNGEVNPAACKDNWSTPRRRMQMMWVRLITDTIVAYWADVIGGAYIVNEIQEDESNDEIIEGESTIRSEPAPAAPEPEPAIVVTVEEQVSYVADTPVVDILPTRPDPNGPVTPETLEKLKQLMKDLELPIDTWKQLIGRYGVASAVHLTQDSAEQLESTLLQAKEDKRLTEDQNAFFENLLGPKT